MKSVVLIIDSPPTSHLCLAVFLGIELFGLTFDFGLKNDLYKPIELSPSAFPILTIKRQGVATIPT